LANYGLNTEFVTRLPENDLGQACTNELKKYSVGTQYIKYGGERLGIYYIETGSVNRPSKVVYDRAHSSFSTVSPEMFDWNSIFEGAEWFHWTGITPAVSEGAAETCLAALKAAKAKGIKISCDLNYRAKLWKWGKKAGEVMPELVSYCDVILGNEEDAEKVFGIKPEGGDVTKGHVDATGYESVCRQLMVRFPNAKKTIITLRGSVNADHNTWAGVLFDGSTLFQSPVYDITHIVDRVGGGDSFMGGLIYGLITYNNDQQALNFAVAASCLKHTIPGDFNLVTVAEVEALMKGDGSGRVQR
jgi:2-dehydro-3-deoxygluconokinase